MDDLYGVIDRFNAKHQVHPITNMALKETQPDVFFSGLFTAFSTTWEAWCKIYLVNASVGSSTSICAEFHTEPL